MHIFSDYIYSIFQFTELPVCSPLIHGILRSLSAWQDILKEELENRGPASVDYIPGRFRNIVSFVAKGPELFFSFKLQ